jgi:hypothetical protein
MNDETNKTSKSHEMKRTPMERLSRREVLRFFAGAGAMLAAGDGLVSAQDAPRAAAEGYGTDPDLTKLYQPGDVWPLTLSPAEKQAATALADVMLPADELGSAASAVRVPDFIDEWVSAPYPDQQEQRPIILKGLKWLDAEANRRFQKTFATLSGKQQIAICDDICDAAKARPGFEPAAEFFQTFRSLAMGAYYSTAEGWKAIGYVGNIASATFGGPPADVLQLLGVEQTVE